MEIAVSVPRGPAVHRHRRQLLLAGCVVAALAAAAMAAAIAASGTTSHPVAIALARALIVGVPIAVGLGVWCRHGNDRFGLLIAAAGAVWLVTTLAESGDELLYTLGRTAGWLVQLLLVYLILAFPTGRLRGRMDRVLMGAMSLVVLTMFLPRLALAESFEVPTPFTSCTMDCPGNAFFLLGDEPAFVDTVMRPGGALLVACVMVALVMRIRERMREATPLARRMFTPVLAVGLAQVGLLAVGLALREADPAFWPVEVVAWALALAVPAIALAFLAGLLRFRLYAAHALQHLAESVRAVPDAATLRQAFAEAFGDPMMEIAFPAGEVEDPWVDSRGRPVTMPEPGSGQSVSELRDRGALVAAVIHDEALEADPQLVDALIGMAAVVLENQRLAADVETATREVRNSRARIAAGAQRERRRIERDLHDGAQQRLVALRIELELAKDLVLSDPERGAGRLEELEAEVDEALEEIRSLAHGVYPPLLADQGLAEALRSAATRSPIPVEVHAHDVGRYAPEVEGAVYFCMLEALQNALKHATGARRVVVRLGDGTGGELRFSVRDDGAGIRDGAPSAGAGITNMRDRLAAIGGDLDVTSAPGVGTTVRGRVPAPARRAV